MMLVDKHEDAINQAIEEVSDKIFKDAESGADAVVRSVDDVRKGITDVLMSYADSEGFIPKHKMKQVLRELDSFDDDIRFSIEEGLKSQVSNSSKRISREVIGTIVTLIGLSAFKTKRSFIDEEELEDELLKYLRVNTVEGLTIYDRITRLSGMIRDRMQEAIRYNILTGKRFTVIALRVKDAVDKVLYNVKTIIKTEIPNVLRKGLSYIADKLKIVKGIRIIDNRGRHPYHYHHMCYKFAEADKYGMGKGIYKPSDTYILNPHPQCTAYFEYVFEDELRR